MGRWLVRPAEVSPERGVHAGNTTFPRQSEQTKFPDYRTEAGTGLPFDDNIPLRNRCGPPATTSLRDGSRAGERAAVVVPLCSSKGIAQLIVTQFPHEITEIEHVLIPLHDGTRLAARIWLPTDAVRKPVPAILEYLPYRKRTGTYDRDALMHPYFAGHGYAAVRIDIRGCGEFGWFAVRGVRATGAG